MRNKLFNRFVIVLVLVSVGFFFVLSADTEAKTLSSSPTITSVKGTPGTSTMYIGFGYKNALNGKIVQVKYSLVAVKTNNVNPPKNKKRIKGIKTTDGHSEIRIPVDSRFSYAVKIKIKEKGKVWSAWSNTWL